MSKHRRPSSQARGALASGRWACPSPRSSHLATACSWTLSAVPSRVLPQPHGPARPSASRGREHRRGTRPGCQRAAIVTVPVPRVRKRGSHDYPHFTDEETKAWGAWCRARGHTARAGSHAPRGRHHHTATPTGPQVTHRALQGWVVWPVPTPSAPSRLETRPLPGCGEGNRGEVPSWATGRSGRPATAQGHPSVSRWVPARQPPPSPVGG